MDYSLLLVVETLQENGLSFVGNSFNFSGRKTYNKYTTLNGKVYHFGLIDWLQTWNLSKKAEKCLKTTFTDQKEISAVPPIKYQKRFINYVKDNVFRKQPSQNV